LESLKTCHSSVRNLFLNIFIKEGDKTDYNNYRGISLLPTTIKISSNILVSRLTPYADKLLGIINVDLDVTDQKLTRHTYSIRQILEKMWDYNGAVHQLFINFEKAYVSVGGKLMYNIIIELCISMKLFGQNKM
jgi:hypothetical protein